ncbi:HNH endonuclease [Aneurinibacillus sp. Ricciae_BoGa-3]|uniref:HNH endonuclease n=1 Tax=Aneurinibacillus sp. Ricciae_BoGa-3 TaxID=3022697 RepID=UPI00233F825E|nr:HNH endonuclease [Aneurinibacillus sp. Ricciae_BoGa-3]WCK55395.1 HNH endonuclease [Aneurinibacillus sp. Ricciae_BoGa-3]
METFKRCTRCKVEKPLSAFRKRPGSFFKSELTERRSHCKACEREYYKKYRKTSPTYRWQKLQHNLKRYPDSDVTAKQLREQLGAPEICYLCGLPLTWNDAELDHVQPLTKGGRTTISNLKWAHKKCNRMKHDYPLNEFYETLKVIYQHMAASNF